MPKYRIACQVMKAQGYQWWSVDADNEADALKKHKAGDSKFDHEEIEVCLAEPEFAELAD